MVMACQHIAWPSAQYCWWASPRRVRVRPGLLSSPRATRESTPTSQILLYERTPDGRYQLNGVEFIVPYALYSRDSVPPLLMGQRLHREDNLNIWYLHVWAWSGNADGVFANFNPAVTSPKETAKVYTPFARDP